MHAHITKHTYATWNWREAGGREVTVILRQARHELALCSVKYDLWTGSCIDGAISTPDFNDDNQIQKSRCI